MMGGSWLATDLQFVQDTACDAQQNKMWPQLMVVKGRWSAMQAPLAPPCTPPSFSEQSLGVTSVSSSHSTGDAAIPGTLPVLLF